MAVKTENGVTTLTPTAWKWFAGAAAAFFFVPGILKTITGLRRLQS